MDVDRDCARARAALRTGGKGPPPGLRPGSRAESNRPGKDGAEVHDILLPGPAIRAWSSGVRRIPRARSDPRPAAGNPGGGPAQGEGLRVTSSNSEETSAGGQPQWRLIRLHLACPAAAELTSRAAGGGTEASPGTNGGPSALILDRGHPARSVLEGRAARRGAVYLGAGVLHLSPDDPPRSKSEHSRSASKPSYLEALAASSKGHPTRAQSAAAASGAMHPLRSSRATTISSARSPGEESPATSPHRGRRRPEQGRSPVRPQAGRGSSAPGVAALLLRSPRIRRSTRRAPWCAPATSHTNARGVPVLDVQRVEGRPLPGARPDLPGMPHAPRARRHRQRPGSLSTQRRINLHRLVGGSAASRIRAGLVLRIESLSLSGASADVQVVASNDGVGHAAPVRPLEQEPRSRRRSGVTASGELMHRRERVYRREMRDAEGRPLVTVPDLFLKAASVGATPASSRRKPGPSASPCLSPRTGKDRSAPRVPRRVRSQGGDEDDTVTEERRLRGN